MTSIGRLTKTFNLLNSHHCQVHLMKQFSKALQKAQAGQSGNQKRLPAPTEDN